MLLVCSIRRPPSTSGQGIAAMAALNSLRSNRKKPSLKDRCVSIVWPFFTPERPERSGLATQANASNMSSISYDCTLGFAYGPPQKNIESSLFRFPSRFPIGKMNYLLIIFPGDARFSHVLVLVCDYSRTVWLRAYQTMFVKFLMHNIPFPNVDPVNHHFFEIHLPTLNLWQGLCWGQGTDQAWTHSHSHMMPYYWLLHVFIIH